MQERKNIDDINEMARISNFLVRRTSFEQHMAAVNAGLLMALVILIVFYGW